MKVIIYSGIIVSIFSFLLGIIFFNYFLDFFKSFFVILFLLLLTVNTFLYREKKYLFFSCLFFFFSLLWLFYSSHFYSGFTDNYKKIEKYFYFSSVSLSWEIVNIEKIKENSKIYLIQVHELNKTPIESTLYWFIELPFNVSLNEWDTAHFTSKIYQINNFSEYNYKLFLASQNIFFRAYPISIEKGQKIQQKQFFEYAWKTRNKIITSLSNLYPKEESILLGWMLIGARENIPKNLESSFNNAWLTHVIAVSGYNITILILFLSFLLSFFPFSVRIFWILFFLVFFAALVWYNPPVIRASIMWFLWFLVLNLWRKPSVFMLILFTTAIMLLFNPFSITYDISFQLSFLAVVWVVYFGDILKKIFWFLPSFFALKESLILTLSALIFTIPLSLFYFWQMSLIAPVSNLLVAPTIPFIMLFWFLSILSSFVFLPLSYLFSYVTYLFLTLDIDLIYFFGWLSWSVLKIPTIDIFFLVVISYYLILFGCIYTQKKE